MATGRKDGKPKVVCLFYLCAITHIDEGKCNVIGQYVPLFNTRNNYMPYLQLSCPTHFV